MRSPLRALSRFQPLSADEFLALPETPLIGQRRPSFLRDAVLYPQIYLWYVLFASLDIMVTWVVLHFGGAEVNPAGQWVIARYNLAGLVVYKFALVMFVILICEIVGRRRERMGHRLAEWAVAITAIPVVIGLTQLLRSVFIHHAEIVEEVTL
ncbi:MAG: hypothetical protein JXO22_16225 [Phycisphaerae bacterium]|nr:hypothetical protein [Phycisphaerae bacterium]